MTKNRPGRNTSALASHADRQRQLVLATVSLLLGYPDRELLGQLPTLGQAVESLPAPAGPGLSRFVDRLEHTPAANLGADYVDTFDLSRRSCLYLTYYTFGDTRMRGRALLRFSQAYRQAGLDPPAGELPDHLAVVCHFAALAPASGIQLLVEHRAAIEVLRCSLANAQSSYLDVVDALGAVLPEPAEADLARALELVRGGPPAEKVGLEPFAPAAYMGVRQ
jgi:nitrate reductase delta subunit